MKEWIGRMKELPFVCLGGIFLGMSLLQEERGGWALDPAWVTVAVCGLPLVWAAGDRLLHGSGIQRISSALLISIAMAAAIGIGYLFAAGEVAFIMGIGEILEDRTREKARRGLKRLLSLAPAMGRRIGANGEQMIRADQIRQGDRLRVLPGESIPADGRVIEGMTSVDQSILTGESLPVDKKAGDPVFCGTVNRFGTVDIEATRVGEQGSLAVLIRMVREAEERKAPMQRVIDCWAGWLVPAALVIAAGTWAVTGDVTRAVTVLVVFCPCALVLATPTAIMAAIGQAAKKGIVIKSGEALERMSRIDTIAFDKTGTLTYGKLAVTDCLSFTPSASAADILRLAGSLEKKSEHPLGKAITAEMAGRKISAEKTEAFQMKAGLGITAFIQGRQYWCGSEAYLAAQGIRLCGKEADQADGLRKEGKALVFLGRREGCLGVLGLADGMRTETPSLLRALQALRIQAVLLTGDHPQAAHYFARLAGFTHVRAGLLPADKVQWVRTLSAEKRKVCMIGDGVNDAPALKAACVGVAMAHGGADIAVDAADIALMNDDLSRIPYLKRLARETVHTIRLGISVSMGINLAAVTLSVYGLLDPTMGALVHNAGSCLVVCMAAMLYDRKLDA